MQSYFQAKGNDDYINNNNGHLNNNQQQPLSNNENQLYYDSSLNYIEQPRLPLQPIVIHNQEIIRVATIVPLAQCCRFCGRDYFQIASKRIGKGALIAFLLLLLICWPLCWLPFVIDDCKDKIYTCSQCGQELNHLLSEYCLYNCQGSKKKIVVELLKDKQYDEWVGHRKRRKMKQTKRQQNQE